jgi:DNA-binding response OmpR family regulator
MSEKLALIVEDDDDLAEIFTQALKAADFDTETIRRGDLALQRLAECQPDVVVLDLHLPEVSGQKILEYIRAEKRLSDTRIVITSADALHAEYLRQHADLVLIKPVTFTQLRDLTARLTSRKRPAKRNF